MRGSTVIGRSIRLREHKTNVSLEDAFWNALQEIAAGRSVQVGELVAAIDTHRQFKNLSSAIRVFVLEHYIAQIPRSRRSAKQMHKAKRGYAAKRTA
jgi:predicted DNA-binding ribbon-helix-helix protein